MNLLDFVYDRKENRYTLDKYKNDDALVKRIQTGKGDKLFMYDGLGKNIFVEAFLGSTKPEVIRQDYIYGSNDLTAAKA